MALDPEDKLRLPVVSAGAEFLVMGLLMRRNVLTYLAPRNHEGYDLIAIHPDPRHKPTAEQLPQVRIQVKSRFQSDSNQTVLIKTGALEAFDFLAVVFMNIGKFYGSNDGTTGAEPFGLMLIPQAFVRLHHVATTKMGKLPLKHLADELMPYRGEHGIELVAAALGVARPVRRLRATVKQAR